MKKKMAFWKYDLYPYLVCSETSDTVRPKKFDGERYYFMESYGTFHKPLFVLSLEKGKELKEHLGMLKSMKRDAEIKIWNEFVDKLDTALDEFGVSRNTGHK